VPPMRRDFPPTKIPARTFLELILLLGVVQKTNERKPQGRNTALRTRTRLPRGRFWQTPDLRRFDGLPGISSIEDPWHLGL